MTSQPSSRADLVAAWAIGVGIGLIALQLTWLLGARLAGLVWGPPTGPIVAFTLACVTGIVVAILSGRLLARKVSRPSPPTGEHTEELLPG